MSTSHRWFRSGSYSLAGHIDNPQTVGSQLGVVIVPPFGWEDVCSYRPLRVFSRMLAAGGIPSLRFDLPGTGDSSGSAQDFMLLEAWIQSLGDAARELRAAAGVEDVAVVGTGLGAMLAVAAAARGANLQDLVLWGPAATGRGVLREFRALQNFEQSESTEVGALPVAGLEVLGFLIAPETLSALERFDLSDLPGLQSRRILILSRDEFPSDAKLIRALEASGSAVEVKKGDGYAAMIGLPHEVLPPYETGRAILEFLTGSPGRHTQSEAETVPVKSVSTQPAAEALRATMIERAGAEVLETMYTFECSSQSVFGILAEPAHEKPRAEWCLLFLNAGAIRHIGPNRMWVEIARRWAACGIASLRIDLQGIGESDGQDNLDVTGLYQDRFLEQIETAMDSLRSRIGAQRFVAIGLCSGAFWAFHAAIRNPDVRGAILLNPSLFFWDPEVDHRRALRRAVKGLTDSDSWRRLARGEIQSERIKQAARGVLGKLRSVQTDGGRQRQIPAEAMADAWAAMERNRSRLTLIFSEGEPLLREMEEEGQMPPRANPLIRCLRMANAGHTFRPLWAQRKAHELIDRELDMLLQDKRVP